MSREQVKCRDRDIEAQKELKLMFRFILTLMLIALLAVLAMQTFSKALGFLPFILAAAISGIVVFFATMIIVEIRALLKRDRIL